MKYVWLGVAVISLIAGVHKTWKQGINDSYLFFIFAIIALIMYWIRKNMKNREKS